MEPIKYDLREINDDIQEWLEGVFPNRHPDVVFSKLLEELEELEDRPTDSWEWADVLILVLDLMHLYGIDPAKAIHWKMDCNKRRNWTFEDGKLKHVRPNPKITLSSRIGGPLADSPDN